MTASRVKLLADRLVLPGHPGLHAQSFMALMDFNILGSVSFFFFLILIQSI